MIEDGEILNAQPENNYFLKIFEDNVTAIHCLVNEVEINIKTVSLADLVKFNIEQQKLCIKLCTKITDQNVTRKFPSYKNVKL